MQILLGFFRYYTRLSNHYAAKILALKTTNHSSPEGVAEVVSAMQPESITFGAEPQMPFDKICELLKTIR